jgi:hypothetical protein
MVPGVSCFLFGKLTQKLNGDEIYGALMSLVMISRVAQAPPSA